MAGISASSSVDITLNTSTAQNLLEQSRHTHSRPVVEARELLSRTSYYKALVIVISTFTILDAVAVAWKPEGDALKVQLTLMALNTVFFVIASLCEMEYMPLTHHNTCVTLWKKLRELFYGEAYLDLVCLCVGWGCIGHYPGVSALRIFRVFRLVWYVKLFAGEEPQGYEPEKHAFDAVRACRRCEMYLNKIQVEMFTAASHGGVVVLGMLLFTAYAVAVLFWVQLPNLDTTDGHTCHDLPNCWMTILRLTFYDGNGFNYLNALVDDGYEVYAALLFGYFFLTAMIFLNGLIGIFGTAFVHADEKHRDGRARTPASVFRDSPKGTSDMDANVLACLNCVHQLLGEVHMLKTEVEDLKNGILATREDAKDDFQTHRHT